MTLKQLKQSISACEVCAPHFQHRPNPIFQIGSSARVLIAGQAPGRITHEAGIPFNDASGDRLRSWMGLSKQNFYDNNKLAIVPMGFCYPGQGKSGDLPPRPECAPTWRKQVIHSMPHIQLTLVIGLHALRWHLGKRIRENLTSTVKAWQEYLPDIIPLPHPSPRNNPWLKKNPWFENEVLPELQSRITKLIG